MEFWLLSYANALCPKLVAMATSLKELGKEVQINHLRKKYLSFGKKIAKIGSVDPEIICLRAIIKKEKKKEINASKIYNSSGEFDEWG